METPMSEETYEGIEIFSENKNFSEWDSYLLSSREEMSDVFS